MKLQPDDLIVQLESTNSRLAKEKILKTAMSLDIPEFFHGLQLALDPRTTFGIRVVPEIPDTREFTPSGLSWDSFMLLVKQLSTREATGNNAISAVKVACDEATQSQWNNWYRRILIKDLKCGLSDKTINKVCKQEKRTDYMIPIFSCQRAVDSVEHPNKMVGVKQIEFKLDGVRCLVLIEKDKVSMYSRNGKEFTNFGHIQHQIEQAIKHFPIQSPIVLDGELMSETFQDLMKQVYRKENVQATDSVLRVFDMVDLESFELGHDKTPQVVRSEKLSSWFDSRKAHLPNVERLDWENVDLNTKVGVDRLSELKQIAMDEGYEGLLIKDPTAGYRCKKTADWLKVKPFISLDMTVVDLLIGTGKNSDRLGAMVVDVMHDDVLVQTNVGSGFSDTQRIEIWENRENIKGSIVEVVADSITKNQDGGYSLRFPRFSRFRGFVPGEKL